MESWRPSFLRYPAGSDYPHAEHPVERRFAWEHGRGMDALKIVLITSRGGSAETRAMGKCQMEAGMVFFAAANVAPLPARSGIGWHESWIEVHGPVLNELVQGGVFSPDSIVLRGAIDAGLEEVRNIIHQRIQNGIVGFRPELSAAALQVLAVYARISITRTEPSRLQRAVNEALSTEPIASVNVETDRDSIRFILNYIS